MTFHTKIWLLLFASLWVPCATFVPQSSSLDQLKTDHHGVLLRRRDIFPLYYRDCHDDIARELQDMIAPGTETQCFLQGLLRSQEPMPAETKKEPEGVSIAFDFRGFHPELSAGVKRLNYIPILDVEHEVPGQLKEYGPEHAWTYFRLDHLVPPQKEFGPDHAWTHFRLQQ